MERLPKAFIEKMKKQLPENEREAFFACYGKKPLKGVRLNPLKGGMYEMKAFLPFLKAPIPWEKNGYYTEEERLGASPFHSAGVFYSQEPSAMSAAPLLEVKPGERVLDLCSAPGGKGTQLAAEMDGKGIIVLNEPISSRAKILSQNVERMGVENAVVCNEYPQDLADKFAGYFDKIMVDAPCSGEGMFRKNADEALAEWSEENVALCAKRQGQILSCATKMLKKGGRLAYSTCTFSWEEDEGQVCDYLQKHPEMRLIKQEKLYPHKVDGEGHFVALFEKTDEGETAKMKEGRPNVCKATEKIFKEFEKKFFKAETFSRLYESGDVLYQIPEGVFDWKGLQVLRVGVRLGEMKNGRFEPSHALAMRTKKEDCKNVLDLRADDCRVEKYLRGEMLEDDGVENGWCLVCIEGYPLGIGKAVSGAVKNHLPKGLRKN